MFIKYREWICSCVCCDEGDLVDHVDATTTTCIDSVDYPLCIQSRSFADDENKAATKRNKHIDIKLQFAKGVILCGDIKAEYVSSCEIIF